jgi:hypothetical protein
VNSFLTVTVARELVQDRLRDADLSRAASDLPPRDRHRTPRRRVAWSRWATVRAAGA